MSGKWNKRGKKNLKQLVRMKFKYPSEIYYVLCLIAYGDYCEQMG